MITGDERWLEAFGIIFGQLERKFRRDIRDEDLEDDLKRDKKEFALQNYMIEFKENTIMECVIA